VMGRECVCAHARERSAVRREYNIGSTGTNADMSTMQRCSIYMHACFEYISEDSV